MGDTPRPHTLGPRASAQDMSTGDNAITMANLDGEQQGTESPSYVSPTVGCVDNDSSDRHRARRAESIGSGPSGVAILLGNSDTMAKAHPKQHLPQPMTESTSSPSLKDAVLGAAPYGTRSRNRAGVSRPNYAEDREIDMEFESQPHIKEDNIRKGSRPSDTRSSALESSDSGVAIRGPAGILPDSNGAAQRMLKDHIPGTSTFSANPAGTALAQPPKKRKATTHSASSMTNGNHPTANLDMTMTTQKNMLPHNVPACRESFMLTFDNCGARLQNAKLIADDGTALGINGKWAYFHRGVLRVFLLSYVLDDIICPCVVLY